MMPDLLPPQQQNQQVAAPNGPSSCTPPCMPLCLPVCTDVESTTATAPTASSTADIPTFTFVTDSSQVVRFGSRKTLTHAKTHLPPCDEHCQQAMDKLKDILPHIPRPYLRSYLRTETPRPPTTPAVRHAPKAPSTRAPPYSINFKNCPKACLPKCDPTCIVEMSSPIVSPSHDYVDEEPTTNSPVCYIPCRPRCDPECIQQYEKTHHQDPIKMRSVAKNAQLSSVDSQDQENSPKEFFRVSTTGGYRSTTPATIVIEEDISAPDLLSQPSDQTGDPSNSFPPSNQNPLILSFVPPPDPESPLFPPPEESPSTTPPAFPALPTGFLLPQAVSSPASYLNLVQQSLSNEPVSESMAYPQTSQEIIESPEELPPYTYGDPFRGTSSTSFTGDASQPAEFIYPPPNTNVVAVTASQNGTTIQAASVFIEPDGFYPLPNQEPSAAALQEIFTEPAEGPAAVTEEHPPPEEIPEEVPELLPDMQPIPEEEFLPPPTPETAYVASETVPDLLPEVPDYVQQPQLVPPPQTMPSPPSTGSPNNYLTVVQQHQLQQQQLLSSGPYAQALAITIVHPNTSYVIPALPPLPIEQPALPSPLDNNSVVYPPPEFPPEPPLPPPDMPPIEEFVPDELGEPLDLSDSFTEHPEPPLPEEPFGPVILPEPEHNPDTSALPSVTLDIPHPLPSNTVPVLAAQSQSFPYPGDLPLPQVDLTILLCPPQCYPLCTANCVLNPTTCPPHCLPACSTACLTSSLASTNNVSPSQVKCIAPCEPQCEEQCIRAASTPVTVLAPIPLPPAPAPVMVHITVTDGEVQCAPQCRPSCDPACLIMYQVLSLFSVISALHPSFPPGSLSSSALLTILFLGLCSGDTATYSRSSTSTSVHSAVSPTMSPSMHSSTHLFFSLS